MSAETYTATVKPLGNRNGYEIRAYSNGRYESKEVLTWRQARRIARKAGFSEPETGATLYARKMMVNLKERNENYKALVEQTWWVTL